MVVLIPFLWIILDTESDMRRCDGDVSPAHGTRSNNEMIFTGGLSRLKYYFHYEKDKRLKPENECGTAWSSWLEFLKEMILIREMIKHFHYGNQ